MRHIEKRQIKKIYAQKVIIATEKLTKMKYEIFIVYNKEIFYFSRIQKI